MREAGRIVALTHQELKKHIKPGISTKELDQIAERFITKQGAIPSFKGYNGFRGSICVSVNEELVHGIPGKRVLRDGDIISIDIGAKLNGYHGDSACAAFPKKDRVIVEGVNMVKKHSKPTQANPQGGILNQEAPIHVSNVMPLDPKTGEVTRVGYKGIILIK